MTARALALNQRALEWLRGQAREPFFLYLHYMDVHGPYSPPAPYDTLFSLSGYARRELSDEEFGRMPPYLRIEGSRRLEDYIRRYDGEIRFWDDCLSAFLEALSEGRLLEKSIIIVTADHGEEFLDHGGFNHGSTLFQEQVKVPLVWRMPGPAKSGMRIESQVELVDVMPTLLSILEIRTDEVLQGDDLRTLMERGTWSPKPAFSEAAAAFGGVPLPEGTIKSVRWGTRKAILNIDTGRACLYDLTEDPGEREDRSGALSTDRHELLSLLAGWLEAASRAGESYGAGEEEAGEELLEKLRALGYIEG
jgi:arylsulfatase A-like enzyme